MDAAWWGTSESGRLMTHICSLSRANLVPDNVALDKNVCRQAMSTASMWGAGERPDDVAPSAGCGRETGRLRRSDSLGVVSGADAIHRQTEGSRRGRHA